MLKFFKDVLELPYLKGDSSKIRKLGWKPEYSFIDLSIFDERHREELLQWKRDKMLKDIGID